MNKISKKELIASSAVKGRSQPTRALRGRLLQCAAVSAAAWVSATSPAHAAIPPECDVENNPDATVIDCQVAAPNTLDPISVADDDQQIIIGSVEVPTSLVADGVGISLLGGGDQVISVAEGSSVQSLGSNAIGVAVIGPDSSLTINANGDVTGRTWGIFASNVGDGNSSIRTSNVTGSGEDGIFLQHDATGVALIDANGTVTGGNDGIRVESGVGSNDIRISAADQVQGGRDGIAVETAQGEATNVSVDAASVSGGRYGIHIDTQISNGPSRVEVNASGRLIGGETGLLLGIGGQESETEVNIVDATGGIQGVIASSLGSIDFVSTGTLTGGDTGLLSISTSDISFALNNVIGENGFGVFLTTDGTGDGSMSLDATGDIFGGAGGIYALHYGAGAATMNVADVTGEEFTGIFVRLFDPDQTDLVLTSSGTIQGGGIGIDVEMNGSGDVQLDLNDVVGLGSDAIFVETSANSQNVRIAASGNVSGEDGGIKLLHGGQGAMSILTQGAVSARTGDAIFVEKLTPGGSFQLVAEGGISGGQDGIDVRYSPAETATISVTDVTGVTGRGISLLLGNGASLGRVEATGTVQGEIEGINVGVDNFGTDIEIEANNVTGVASDGVVVFGSESVSVQTSGFVSGFTNGIDVRTLNGTVSVLANEVQGETENGIAVEKVNDGDVVIATDGIVSGGLIGIDVDHLANGNVTVAASELVKGGERGIQVLRIGEGNTGISASDVEGANFGIFANQQAAAGGDLIVDVAGTATGNTGGGIAVQNAGQGVTFVNAENAISTDGVGILVQAGVVPTEIRVTSTGSVEGGTTGVIAFGFNGTVNASLNNVSASLGQAVALQGTEINADISGRVDGNNGGISVETLFGGVSSLTIGENAVVNGGNSFAIDFSDSAADSVNKLSNFGTVEESDLGFIWMSDGQDTIFNAGVLDTRRYILLDGNDLVQNEGTIIGEVFFGDGEDVFENSGFFTGGVKGGQTGQVLIRNFEGGFFEASESFGFDDTNDIDLGGSGIFENAGTLSSGAGTDIETTDIDADFAQGDTGSLLIDADMTSGESDRFDISGNTIIDGTVDVRLQNFAAGEQEYLIVTSGDGIFDGGLRIGNMLINPALTLDLEVRNDAEIFMLSKIDFAPDGLLNINQTNVGEALNGVFGIDPALLAPLTDALLDQNLDEQSYIQAINELVPEIYLNTQQTSLLAARDFSSDLQGCTDRDGRVREDEKGCAKLVIGGDLLDRDGSSELIGFEDGTLTMQGNYFLPLGEKLTLGVGVGYDDTLVKNDIAARAQGHRFNVGTSLFYRDNGFEVGGILSAGFGSYDVTRRIAFGDFSSESRGDQDVRSLSAELATAYTFELGNMYVKPGVSLLATQLRSGSLEEEGGIATDYAFDRASEWYLAARPSLEIGGDFETAKGKRIQPFVRSTANILFEDEFALSGRFADGPEAAAGFLTFSELDQTIVDVDAGLRLRLGEYSVLSAEYNGSYSSDIEAHGFRFRASFAF